MQLLTVKFAQIASEIDSTNAQITALQAKLSELQEFQQQLLSVEQAVQSALSQVDQALLMLNHVDPTQIEIFKDALSVKFANSAIGLIEPAAPPAPEPAPEPIVPDAPRPDKTDTVLDVQVTPTAPTEPELLQGNNIEQALQEGDIEQELNELSLPSRSSLAKSKSIDARGTKANLSARLKKIITHAELRAASYLLGVTRPTFKLVGHLKIHHHDISFQKSPKHSKRAYRHDL